MTEESSRRLRPKTLLPWIVLAVGVPASLFLSTTVREAVERVAQLRFERQVSDARAMIESRIRTYADVLYGVRAHFSSENQVNRLQFHRFVESLDLHNRYPGFELVNFALYVPDSERDRFVRSVREDRSLDPRGYPDFNIVPPGRRDHCTS